MGERRHGSRLWAPVVWPLAVLWLGLQGAGSAAGRGLDAYDRGADAAFRAAARAGRAVLRALGPLGRAVRRLAAPVLRLLRRAWDAVGVWLMTRMFRPLGRAARWLVARLRPTVERLVDWGRRQVARLEPVLQALAAGVDAVERAAGRLGRHLAQRVAPVRRAVAALRGTWSGA